MPATPPNKKLLNTAEAAEHCNSTESTLEKKRVYGGGPIYIKIGRKVLYSVSDLDDWLFSLRRRSTSDIAPAGQCGLATTAPANERSDAVRSGGSPK